MHLTQEQLAKIQANSQKRLEAFSGDIMSKIFPRKNDELIVGFVPDKVFEIVRAVDEHKNVLDDSLKNLPPFLCLGEQCQMCADIEEHGSLRSEYQYFQWTMSRRTLCYVYVLEYEGDNRYVNTKAHALLVGPQALGKAVLKITKNLRTEAELRGFWEPEHPGPVFTLRFQERGKVEIEARNKSVAVPPLPKSWPALTAAYIAEGSVPDPEVMKAYRLGFARWIERRTNVKTVSELAGSPAMDESKQGTEVGSAAKDQDPVVITETGEPDDDVPRNCPTSFGKKPPRFLPVCLTCPVDAECAKATEKETGSI